MKLMGNPLNSLFILSGVHWIMTSTPKMASHPRIIVNFPTCFKLFLKLQYLDKTVVVTGSKFFFKMTDDGIMIILLTASMGSGSTDTGSGTGIDAGTDAGSGTGFE